MPPLYIDLNSVEQLRDKHNKLSSRLSQAANVIASMAYGVDSAITARRNIRSRIASSTARMRLLEQRMTMLCVLMQNAVEKYGDMEKDLTCKAGDLFSHNHKPWLKGIMDAVDHFSIRSVLDAISKWLNSEAGKPVKDYMQTMEKSPPPNACPAPPKPVDYTKLVGSYEWVNTKNGRKFPN